MRKRKWMKAGACALSAVLIMGLYAGPAFAEWVGTGAARAYILNGQVQTGWQQIDGKWYYLNEQGAVFLYGVGGNGQRCCLDQWKNLLFWHTGQWRDGNGRCQYQRNSLYV